MCECSFIGPVTPGPDATDSLHEGVSRVGVRDVDDDDAACFLLSIACARVWVIECKGCLANAFGHPLLSLLSSIILFYFTYIYLYSRLTTNRGEHPYYSSRKKSEGSGRRGRSARLIASRQRKFSRCRYQDSVLSCRSIESSSSSSFEKERSNLDRKLETRGLRLLRGSSLSLIDIYDLGCFRIKRMLRSTI